MAEVELKRKVTLKRKNEGESSGHPKPPKNKWWLWISLSALLVVVAVIFFVTKPPSKVGNTGKVTTVEQPVSTTNTGTETTTESGETSTSKTSDETSPVNPPPAPATGNAQGNQPEPKPMPTPPPPLEPTPLSVEEKAMRVIRGDFGNGEERRQQLGSEYNTIQQRVNEMYRDGIVL
jgi:hypothetical protein